jgi:saposin
MLKFLIPIFILASLASATPVEVKSELKPLTAGPICQICTTVLTAAQSYLEQNKTEDQVLAFIEKQLCGKLGALNATCVQYVESYGKVILYELSQKIDPSIICHNIGLCAMKPVPPHNILKPIANHASLNCTLCKTVFTQIDNLIKSNATQAQLIATIEQDLCNATGTMNTACKTLIDTFGPMILKYLANGIDPEKVCELIGMCPKNSTVLPLPVAVHVKADPTLCTLCQYVVQYAETLLKNNASEAQIIKSLELVCNLAPSALKAECNSLIAQYGQYIVELLIQFGGDPKKVCSAIKIC